MSVEKKLIEILTEILNLREDEISLDMSLADDLGADSLAITEIALRVEEEYNIEISDDDLENLVTVKDAVEYLNKRLSQ